MARGNKKRVASTMRARFANQRDRSNWQALVKDLIQNASAARIVDEANKIELSLSVVPDSSIVESVRKELSVLAPLRKSLESALASLATHHELDDVKLAELVKNLSAELATVKSLAKEQSKTSAPATPQPVVDLTKLTTRMDSLQSSVDKLSAKDAPAPVKVEKPAPARPAPRAEPQLSRADMEKALKASFESSLKEISQRFKSLEAQLKKTPIAPRPPVEPRKPAPKPTVREVEDIDAEEAESKQVMKAAKKPNSLWEDTRVNSPIPSSALKPTKLDSEEDEATASPTRPRISVDSTDSPATQRTSVKADLPKYSAQLQYLETLQASGTQRLEAAIQDLASVVRSMKGGEKVKRSTKVLVDTFDYEGITDSIREGLDKVASKLAPQKVASTPKPVNRKGAVDQEKLLRGLVAAGDRQSLRLFKKLVTEGLKTERTLQKEFLSDRKNLQVEFHAQLATLKEGDFTDLVEPDKIAELVSDTNRLLASLQDGNRKEFDRLSSKMEDLGSNYSVPEEFEDQLSSLRKDIRDDLEKRDRRKGPVAGLLRKAGEKAYSAVEGFGLGPLTVGNAVRAVQKLNAGVQTVGEFVRNRMDELHAVQKASEIRSTLRASTAPEPVVRVEAPQGAEGNPFTPTGHYLQPPEPTTAPTGTTKEEAPKEPAEPPVLVQERIVEIHKEPTKYLPSQQVPPKETAETLPIQQVVPKEEAPKEPAEPPVLVQERIVEIHKEAPKESSQTGTVRSVPPKAVDPESTKAVPVTPAKSLLSVATKQPPLPVSKERIPFGSLKVASVKALMTNVVRSVLLESSTSADPTYTQRTTNPVPVVPLPSKGLEQKKLDAPTDAQTALKDTQDDEDRRLFRRQVALLEQLVLQQKSDGKDMGDSGGAIGSLVGSLLGALGLKKLLGKGFLRGSLGMLKTAGKFLLSGATMVGRMLAAAVGAISSTVGALVGVATKFGKYLVSAIPRAAALLGPIAAVMSAAYAGWQIGTAIYGKFSEQILDGIDSVVGAVTKVINFISDGVNWFKDFLDNPAKKLSELGSAISSAWKNSAFGKAAGSAGTFVASGLGFLKDSAGTVAEVAKHAPERVAESVRTTVEEQAPKVASLVKATQGIARDTSATVKSAAVAAAPVLTKATDTAKTVAVSVGKSASAGYSSAVDTTSRGIETVATKFSSLKEAAGKLFRTSGKVDLDGVKPGVQQNFVAMAQEYKDRGGKGTIQINSAFRSPEDQARLYKENPSKAAPPGKSSHGLGLALDINSREANELDSMGLLSKYGFSRPVRGEAWHLQAAGTSKVLASQGVYSADVPGSQSARASTTVAKSSRPSTVTDVAPSVVREEQSNIPEDVVPGHQSNDQVSKGSNPRGIASSPSGNSASSVPTFSYSDGGFFVMNAGLFAG